MTRRRQLIERPKRTLGALGVGLCAIGVAVGSGADFSAQTANPSNTFSAGSLSMDNSKDGAAIFSPTNMKPGGPAQSGVVDIENTGTLPGRFALSRETLTSSDVASGNPNPFASMVRVVIVDCGAFDAATAPSCGDPGDRTLYSGTLQGETTEHTLGFYNPGERHRYRFSGSLDASAGDEYEGESANATYVFSATQN